MGMVMRVVAMFAVLMVVVMVVRVVMPMMMVMTVIGLEEVRVDVELRVEVEAFQVEDLGNRDFTKVHRLLRGARVHVLQSVDQRVHCLLGHEVGLADEDLVSEAHLTPRFLARVELGVGVFGIHQGEDGVQQVAAGHFVVHEEGLRHRPGVGQAGGFDDHAVKAQLALAALFGQVGQGAAQVFPNGAAHAAVAHLDDLLLGVDRQDVVVDVLLAELVFDHGDLLPVGLGQHALE